MKIIRFAFLLSVWMLCAASLTAISNKPKIKHFDFKLVMPAVGMTLEEANGQPLTSAKTTYGDLAEKGLASVVNLAWEGEFDESDEDHPKFKAGYTYESVINVILDADCPYVINYVMKNNSYFSDETLVSATLNGASANVINATPVSITLHVFYTVPGGNGKPLEREDHSSYQKERAEAMKTIFSYSTAQADALWVGKQAYDVVVLNEKTLPADGFHSDLLMSKSDMFPGVQDHLFITKLIADFDCPQSKYIHFSEFANFLGGPLNLKEVWLSEKIDATRLIEVVNEHIAQGLHPGERSYRLQSTCFLSGKATLYIPASQAAAVRALLTKDDTEPVYGIRTYTGDVYAAQKAGRNATKELCTKHVYTKKIKSADRVYHYPTCQTDLQWYYSCATCGKCEYNKNHTFSQAILAPANAKNSQTVGKSTHAFIENLATDEAYAGVNAAGEHVYYKSCIWCGRPGNHFDEHSAMEQWKQSGMGIDFATYKKDMEYSHKVDLQRVKSATVALPDMFSLPKKAKGKMSASKQSIVNYAVSDNLVDEQLLGNDYTRSITRLQLSSIAVRLAEEMLGNPVKPASDKPFTDTDNAYAAKAAAMGLTDGIVSNVFQPNAIATKQEMGTFIYRALRYIERNSSYTYTDYDSKLSKYTDQGLLKDWAKEPMAFMTALELIKGATSTQLAPNENCSIEQAIAVADNSLFAHKIGWYQALAKGERNDLGWDEFISINSESANKYRGNLIFSVTSFAFSDRVWGILPRRGLPHHLPVRDPYTLQENYLRDDWFRPVRWRGTYTQATAKAKAKKEVTKATSESKKKAGSEGKNVLRKGLKNLINGLK